MKGYRLLSCFRSREIPNIFSAMSTTIKEIKRTRLGVTVRFLLLILTFVFTAGSSPIPTSAFQVQELQPLPQVEAAPTRINGPRTEPKLPVARVSTRNHSVWFGEVFTDQFTLSEERAEAIASSSSADNEPEWYSAAKLGFTLEELGFEVVRGLSIPAKEELSSFDMLIIPIPNQRILATDDFLDTAIDLVFQGMSLLIFLDQKTPPYINGLTQEFGITVHGGTVLFPELRRDQGAFDITNIGQNHPITAGISSIRVNWSAPMTTSPPRLDAKVQALAFAPDEMVAGRATAPGPYAFAVAVEYGKGKIAIVADQSSFRGFGEEGEIGFNTLKWLSTSAAAPVASPAPQLPAHFHAGKAVVDSKQAPEGTTVSAWIDGHVVAKTTVEGGKYKLAVRQPYGQSYAGKSVTYRVGGVQTGERRNWTPSGDTVVNLFAYVHQGASGGQERLPGRFIRECVNNALGWLPSSKEDMTAQELRKANELCPSLIGRWGALRGGSDFRPAEDQQPAAHVFEGKAILLGGLAQDGTGVAAFVDGVNISGTRTRDGRFRLVVPQSPDQSFAGRMVEFRGSTPQGRRFDWLNSAVWTGGVSSITLGPEVRYSSLQGREASIPRGPYVSSSSRQGGVTSIPMGQIVPDSSWRGGATSITPGPVDSAPTPGRGISRGFFTNSASGNMDDLNRFMDPTTLAVLGILLTLVVSHVWNRRDRGGEVCPWRPGC